MTAIDTNLKKILQKIYDEIAINGGEISVSSPEYKRTEIDALIMRGFLSKIDASTLEGWAYILRPTYEGEQLLSDEKNPLREKEEDLIRRGEDIGIKEAHTLVGNHKILISGPMYDKWMGEINIFNERHLKENPLHNSIHSTYFHHQNKDSSYDDMMGHLRALEADEEFLGASDNKNGEDRIMVNNSIAYMLIEDINRCKKFFDNPNDEDYGRTIYDEITGRYDLIIPDFGNGLYQYFSEQHFYDPDISGNTLKFNLKKLMNKMETYLALKYPAVNIVGENQPKDNSSEKGGVKKLSKEVFIVHGHDDAAKQEMARTLEKAGFKAIILHEQPDGGRTIIEKIERFTNVAFAVVLYTECDLGRAKEDNPDAERYRARQNVVFEHGYLIGKLGRNNVCAFVKGNVETPGDISGVVYTTMDVNGAWKIQLANNMKDAGLNVDLNELCR